MLMIFFVLATIVLVEYCFIRTAFHGGQLARICIQKGKKKESFFLGMMSVVLAIMALGWIVILWNNGLLPFLINTVKDWFTGATGIPF